MFLTNAKSDKIFHITAVVIAMGALGCLPTPTHATFIGDLVYCDVDANGVYDEYDLPLSGVSVRVTCTANDASICYDQSFVTGADPSGVADVGLQPQFCGDPADPPSDSTWNPITEGAQPGRYLHEVWNNCNTFPGPWLCTVNVDPSTLPASCNQLVTPVLGGPPNPDPITGDFCETGPFPEGQPLGNTESWGGCLNYPDPAPANETFTVQVSPIGEDECNIHNDFGYTYADGFDGCTPGFWKQAHHREYWPVDPDTLFNDVFDCSTPLFDPDITLWEAIRLRGGGVDKVGRHGTAAYLNSFSSDVDFPASFEDIRQAVCSGNVDSLVPYNELSDDCPAKDSDYDFGF